MAHVEKYTAHDTKKLFDESNREHDQTDRYRNAVDLSRSHQNYELASHGLGEQEFLEKRLGEVDKKRYIAGETNVMCSWIVTLPQGLDFDEDEERQFFEETHSFMQERYGAENTISSMVHRDETQPHLHYMFVPVMQYTSKQGEERQKLCAKDVVNRRDLQTFHDDLSEHLENVFGFDLGILNEATKDGNESIKSLKRKSASKQMAEIEAERKKLFQEKNRFRVEKEDFIAEKEEYQKEKAEFSTEMRRERKIIELEKQTNKANYDLNLKTYGEYTAARDAHKAALVTFKKTTKPGDARRTQQFNIGAEAYKNAEKELGND